MMNYEKLFPDTNIRVSISFTSLSILTIELMILNGFM